MNPIRNYLIRALSFEDRHALTSACEIVDLPVAHVICDTGDETTHAYFPLSCVLSFVSMADARAGAELGMCGPEGVFGSHLVLGALPSPLRTLVQSAGTALRIPAEVFVNQLRQSATLSEWIARYHYVQMCVQATSAACLRFHQTDQRLARWLLMTQDRIAGEHVPMTQEFLAYLLGVRRLGTTIATSSLLRDGVIGYSAGRVSVLNRDGLLAASCSCYAADRRVHESVLGFRVNGL